MCLIYTSAIMNIRRIFGNRVYLALVLIYAISVVALCFRAPVVLKPIQLNPDEIEEEPAPSSSNGATSAQSGQPLDDLGFVPVTGPGGKSLEPESVTKRAPVWAIGSELSLNVRRFTEEQVELIGLVLLVALTYRFRARILNWGAVIAAFIAFRRRGTCVWLGFAVIFILTLYPPWVRVWNLGQYGGTQRVKLWHAPEWRPPIDQSSHTYPAIDYPGMFIEILAGECFVLALYFTWARTKQNSKP
jgi:hypothetical protein